MTGQRSATARLVERLGGLVPPWLGGQLHRLPPRLTFGLVGPFNGQQRRAAAVGAMFARIPFTAIVETGTFRAITTRFLRTLSAAPLATIEINPRYHHYSRQRLAGQPNLFMFLGDSPAVLELLAADAAWTDGPAFFYLDAHWLDNLPLVDELRIIRARWPHFVAVIDDFRVDGDDGYRYDDYGPGKSLERNLLEVPELAGLHLFWPAAPSTDETGMRQGWVVVASAGEMADALASLADLRDGGRLGSGQ
jgi:hypothetical protein